MRSRTIGVVLVLFPAIVAAVWLFLGTSGGFSARAEPSAPEKAVARLARRLATPANARQVRNPTAFSPEVWSDARAHFADHCAICHGNDGRGQTDIGQHLYPKAPDMRLADTQQLSDGELYWIIENGVRLTGMPAWGDGSDHDTDTWKLVHFIRHLNELTAAHLKEMEALNPRSPEELREEREDREFLEGKPAAPSPGRPHQHTEKEKHEEK